MTIKGKFIRKPAVFLSRWIFVLVVVGIFLFSILCLEAYNNSRIRGLVTQVNLLNTQLEDTKTLLYMYLGSLQNDNCRQDCELYFVANFSMPLNLTQKDFTECLSRCSSSTVIR